MRIALEAALERARAQIEALAVAAAELETTLPERVGTPSARVRDEALPVARNLAEVRGLLNSAIRRLERIEGDCSRERHARVDDLALLVDLICPAGRASTSASQRIERS